MASPHTLPLQSARRLWQTFLSARVLAAANMPRSRVWSDLLALSEACGGRLHTCPDRSGIDRHIKARIDGGLLVVN